MNSGRANVANLYQLYTLIEKYKILFIGLVPIVCAQLKNSISAQSDSTAHKGLVHKNTINHSYCMCSNSCD